MVDIKTELETFVAAARRFGAQLPVRVKLTTEEAIAFLKSLEQKAVQNAEPVFAHAKAFEELAKVDVAALAKKGRADLTAHLNSMAAHEHKFWEAFHGQPHGDAEVVRRTEPPPPAAAQQAAEPATGAKP